MALALLAMLVIVSLGELSLRLLKAAAAEPPAICSSPRPLPQQASTGAYLKLHIERLRTIPLVVHKITGRLYPLVGALQILLGVQMWWTLCLGEEQLQCLAHHTFGFSYCVYGTSLAVRLDSSSSRPRLSSLTSLPRATHR